MNALVQKAGITTDDIDWVVCHQANVRILDASIRRLGMPAEKFYRNLDRYANTSAASIPLALDEMRENGLLQPGQKMILVGFGGGLDVGGPCIWRSDMKTAFLYAGQGSAARRHWDGIFTPRRPPSARHSTRQSWILTCMRSVLTALRRR